jgi:hypothetical protein
MNTGARLGLAVTAGYVLGRMHKMKWALAIAAMVGRGRLCSASGGLLQQGAKALTSSPEFAKLTDDMKGRLVEAGKAAAVAAVSSKINSLSDGLRDRSDAIRAGGSGGSAASDEDEEADEEDARYSGEDRAAHAGRKRRPDQDDDGHVPAPRRGGSRGEPARAGRQSGSRAEAADRSRASHPSRHSGDGHRERGGAGARQGQDGGRSRSRSSASRSGGDKE